MVLRERSVPQGSAQDDNFGEQLGLRHTVQKDTTTAKIYDLMHIDIVLYTLSGIRVEYSSCGGAKKASKKRRQLKKSCSQALSTSTAPLTAFASCRRNVLSSGTAIETFLPSLCLEEPDRANGKINHLLAAWYGDESPFLVGNKQSSHRSLFHITRVMRRHVYRRRFEKEMGLIANYEPETVDLSVGVARGKELIHLGTASITITGDEEEERILSVPVRSLQAKKRRRIFFQALRGGKRNDHFLGDQGLKYALEENATMRVGVRVLPKELAEKAALRAKAPMKASEQVNNESIGDRHEGMILELIAGDDSLVDKLGISSDDKEPRRLCGYGCHAISHDTSMTGMLCSAYNDLYVALGVSGREAKNWAANEVHNAPLSKVTSAIVMPPSFLSTFSDSDAGSETLGGTQFVPQRAIL